MSDPCLHLDHQLCFSLYAASRLVTRLYQPLLEPLGLTYPQYITMLVLWEDAPCRVSHICDRTLLQSNTLTPLLKRLEGQGLITRQRAAGDERVVEISLTPEGRTLQDACVSIPQRLMGLCQGTEQEALQLKGALDALIGQLRTVSD